MRERVKKVVTREETFVSDVLCNVCGKTCKDDLDMNFECATVHANWGYGSRKDTELHEAHICEDCYDEYVKIWKLPPTID